MKKEEDKEQKESEEEPAFEEDKEETSDLEEEVKDIKDSLDKNQFQEFIQQSSTSIAQPTESFSPVLKRAEIPEQVTDLEQNIASSPTLGIDEKEDEDKSKYAIKYVQEDYNSVPEESRRTGENFSVMQPTQIDIENVGRDLHPQLRGVAPVNLDDWEVRKQQGTLEEKYVKPEKMDMEKVGRETPFETGIREVEKKKLDYEIR